MGTLSSPRRSSIAIIVGADVCALVAALATQPVVTVVFGLPLALILPGAALVLAVDPWRRQVRGAQRLMWTVAASLGLVVFGGLLLNVLGGLTQTSWLILITSSVLLLGVVAWFRGGPSTAGADRWRADTAEEISSVGTEEVEEGAALLVGNSDSAEQRGSANRSRHPVGIRQVALLLAAAVVAAGGMWLSVSSASTSSRESFVQAWILTQPVDDPGSTKVHFGITNYEGRRTQFILNETIGRSSPSQQVITLDDRQSWRAEILRKSGEQVVVTVRLTSHPQTTVATVQLAVPSKHVGVTSGSTTTTPGSKKATTTTPAKPTVTSTSASRAP
jgi:hypothetical protein